MTTLDRLDAPVRSIASRPIIAPAVLVVATSWPAIWNPSPLIRHAAASLLVLGLLWLVGAGVATVRRWFIRAEVLVDDLRVDLIRQRAIAELGGDCEDAIWAHLVRQLRDDLHRGDQA